MSLVTFAKKIMTPLTAVLLLLSLSACKTGFESDGDGGSGGGNGGGTENEVTFVGPGMWELELNRRDETFVMERRTEPGAEADLTISGTYEQLSSGFTRMNVTDVSDTAAQLKSAFNAVEISDEYVVLQPVENNSDQIITMVVAGECPENDLSGNWITYDTTTAADATAEDQGFFGTYTFAVSSGIGVLQTRYNLENYEAVSNLVTLDGEACDDGISEADTVVQYVSPNSGAIVHSNTDNTDTSQLLFVMDTKEIATRADLNSEHYVGFYYDSTFSASAQSIPVSISCDNGDCEMREVENIESGQESTSVYEISFETPGGIAEGFVTGIITDPQDNQGNIACSVDNDFLDKGEIVWACAGQSPTANAEFINLFITTK